MSTTKQIMIPTPLADSNGSLSSVLNCFICKNIVKKAQICPICSKLFCQQCIKDWLYNHQHKCPNCFNFLTKDKIVSCFKLSQQLIQTLNRLNQLESFTKCNAHMLSNSYYCITCSKAVCSDCCVISTQVRINDIQHAGHKFSKVKLMKQKMQQKRIDLLKKIQQTKEKIQKQKQIYQDKINQINPSKSDIKLLENHLTLLNNTVHNKIDESIDQISNLKQQHSHVYNKLTKSYQQISQCLMNCSKVKFIKDYIIIKKQLQENIQKLNQNNSSTINRNITLDELESQLIPHYNKKLFILNNYSSIRINKQCVYSEIFQTNGLQWRLKIYPNGNNQELNGIDQKLKDRKLRPQCLKSPKNGNYLSIFIQLKSGLQKLGRYRHKIQIENSKNSSLKISRQFQSDFQSGQCWGYNNFVKIQTLYDEGYINIAQDSLKIVFYVCPSTYYFASLDQQSIINSKLQIIRKNEKTMNELYSNISFMKRFHKGEQNKSISTCRTSMHKYHQSQLNSSDSKRQKKSVMSSAYLEDGIYNRKLQYRLKKSKSNEGNFKQVIEI